MFVLIFEKLLLEVFLDLLYFPIWWYSGGVKYAAGRFLDFLKSGNRIFAPGIWIQNIFVPMYGQYDWQGRLVSFIMRAAQIIFRLAAFFVWFCGSLAIFLTWLILPILILYGLFLPLKK